MITDEVGVLNANIFGEPSGPIFYDSIQCSDENDYLLECENTQLHMCNHKQDVAIICHRKFYSLFIHEIILAISFQKRNRM